MQAPSSQTLYVPISSRTQALITTILIGMGLGFLSLLLDAVHLRTLYDPRFLVQKDLLARLRLFAEYTDYCISALWFILLLVWSHRAYKNLYAFGLQGLSFSPLFVVVSYFIPLLNILFPFLILREIWKGSDPDFQAQDRSWKKRPTPLFLWVWWIALLLVLLTLILFVGLTIWFDSTEGTDALNTQLLDGWTLIVADLSSLLLGGLDILVLKKLTQRQEEKGRKLYFQ